MRAAIGIVAALVLGHGTAQAAPVNYDCDTNEGSYSELSQVQAGPDYHVRGTIRPLQVRAHERYLPSAQIRLENAAETEAIAVQLVGRQGTDQFDILVTLGAGPSATLARTSIGTLRLNQSVPFDLAVSSAGEASVRIGVERRTFRVALGAGAKLSVICSTGEFEFSGLDWNG
jgi:hypothetical protein